LRIENWEDEAIAESIVASASFADAKHSDAFEGFDGNAVGNCAIKEPSPGVWGKTKLKPLDDFRFKSSFKEVHSRCVSQCRCFGGSSVCGMISGLVVRLVVQEASVRSHDPFHRSVEHSFIG